MDHIRSAVLFICLTAFGLTLASAILPEGKYERQLRLMTAALMLSAILRPLAGIRLPVHRTESGSAEAASELVALAEQARDQAVSESIRRTLEQQLAANDVPCQVTAVDAHISGDGSITISEVQVSGNLLTGSIYLHEWLGSSVAVTEGGN